MYSFIMSVDTILILERENLFDTFKNQRTA